ncbi:uncharacterized protein LOC135462529 [Liolophura sinensis]|uniref:uncharacterized protein LOC135462529 n=1 Tax=Liolophura sinensis TaxID=3198878 RepID=UPI0031584DC9
MSTIKRLLHKSMSGSLDKLGLIERGSLRKSSSEMQLSSLVDFEYRRWATANKLSKHTRQMLALEHFDSMATIKMLSPDMVYLLNLSEDESNKLMRALGKLHMTSKPGFQAEVTSDSGYVDDSSQSDGDSEAEYLQRMSRLRYSHSMPVLCNEIYLPGRELKSNRGHDLEQPNGGSPTSFCIHGNDDSESIGTVDSVMENVHSLRQEELQDILEYMVLEDITTREIQEEILSQNPYRKKVALLKKVMEEAGETTRLNLEEILRTNYNASLPTISESLENSWEESDNASDRWRVGIRGRPKRVSWKLAPLEVSHINNHNNINKNKCCHDNVSGKSLPLDPDVFVINVEDNRTKGFVNPFFEDDEGIVELRKSPLLRFGHKGRQDGELQDSTSVVSLDNGDIIVTDHVNSKLQSFDHFGAPVKTLAIHDKKQPWNIVLSPHGWVAVTFKGSKTLSILDEHGKEIAWVGDEIFKNPAGLAVDKNDRYIVTDATSNNVYVHTFEPGSNSFVTNKLNTAVSFAQPRYVTVSPNGDIIVSDSGNHCIKIFTSEGEFKSQFGSYGQASGYFRCPYGVCTDHQGNILVADHYNSRISMFSPRGGFLRNLVTRNHGLKRPQGVHISDDQKLYITHGRMKASEILVFDLQDSNNDAESTHL